MAHEKSIYIKGARVHNLKNIEVEIPHEKLVVVTGLSGSGKSTLAFDTIFAEGQRRYVESLSAYARQFLGKISKPDVDIITGIAPAIAIEQKVNSRNPRSTVGTSTEIYEYLRLLYARIGRTFSPVSGQEVKKHSTEDIVNCMLSYSPGTRFTVLTPLRIPEGRSVIEQVGYGPETGIHTPGYQRRDGTHRGLSPATQRTGSGCGNPEGHLSAHRPYELRHVAIGHIPPDRLCRNGILRGGRYLCATLLPGRHSAFLLHTV